MDPAPSDYPAVSIGHVTLTVADLEASYRFYDALGLRSFAKDDGLAIFELRGGTHLLLFPRGDGAPQPDGLAADAETASLDLMIPGRTLEALQSYREGLIGAGFPAQPIPDERYYGHYVFQTEDPDGHKIQVSTSHASNLPV
jgi:catechol 2,3-dioxygenase-like lactoylglutathione lyase family enzyme